MKYFKHTDAYTVNEAAEAKAHGAAAIAGGTDLLGALKDKILPEYPEEVVNLKTIPGLDRIEETEGGIRIGANVKLADLAASELVRAKAPAVAQAAYSVASPLIRNSATVGGNICQDVRCWYYRYPNQIGGKILCNRKCDGAQCYAFTGENKYHSIFGGMRVHCSGCSQGCPAHIDIPQYMEKIRANDLDGAAEILLRRNPLPAMTGRVCPHSCMDDCKRDRYDESVNINQIERFMGDYILENASRLMPAPAAETGRKIAIAGSGPAALSAAYYLRREGHSVTVYERMEEPGGALMYAIPEYRLPKDLVRKQIRVIADMGVKFVCGTKIGEDITVEQLQAENDKVFLDTGAWEPSVLGIEGEELTRFGLEFLVEVKKWMNDKPGANVIVVGGGSVAVDVAVTANRLGAKSVTMVTLEPADQLPATKKDLEWALEEGIRMENSWGPKRILRDGSKITGLELKRCVSLRDESGRFSPAYDENDTMVVEGDAIFLSIGHRIDLSFLGEDPFLATERGRIAVNEETQATSKEGIYAGGDVTTGTKTVVLAIAAGKKAADAMITEFGGKKDEPLKEGFVKAGAHCLDHTPQLETPHVPAAERTIDKEDELGSSFEEIRQEANRCFNCSCYAVTPSDVATSLMALHAQIVTNKAVYDADTFFTTKVKIADFLAEDEIVTAIEIPAAKGVNNYDKFRERESIDFAVVGLASSYELQNGVIESADIVLGAVAPVPVRAAEAEAFLKGKKVSAEVAKEAAEIALAKADALEDTEYKVDIAKTLIRRSIEKLA
ncbi:MAG: FAD binding domain-containing protein [Mogibacterium sp.]|nr:FAD binding domain-containing protein [Mogibacterium sp.]